MIQWLFSSTLLGSCSQRCLFSVPEEEKEVIRTQLEEEVKLPHILTDLLQSREVRDYTEELALSYLHRFSLRKRQEYQDLFQHYRDIKSHSSTRTFPRKIS